MSFHDQLRGLALHGPTNETVENNTGSSIDKLKVVTLDGHGTVYPQVRISNSTVDVNFGIAAQQILDGQSGTVTAFGFLQNVDTSGFVVGTTLYGDATGNLTATNNGAGAVAIVVKQDATCGVLYVIAIADQFQGATNFWGLEGNSGLDDMINFLGTIDAVGLVTKTNNTQRQKIDENGNTAIGQHDPDGFLHLKNHSGFDGSGNIFDTNAISTADTDWNEIYSYDVADLCTVVINTTIAGQEDDISERATFTRTASFYRNGLTVSQEGLTQSDYTFKSSSGFNVRIRPESDKIKVEVKANTSDNTRWSANISLTIIKNP